MAKEDEATQPYGRTPRRHRIDTPVRVSDTETDVTQATAAAEEVKSLIGFANVDGRIRHRSSETRDTTRRASLTEVASHGEPAGKDGQPVGIAHAKLRRKASYSIGRCWSNLRQDEDKPI